MKISYRMKLLIFLTGLVPVFTIELPETLKNHLDTRSPHYISTLRPWNSTTGSARADISSLKYVIGLFRHGNRSPGETYKGDKYPFNDTLFWPEGPKQLTKVGKNQLFNVGKVLRERYNGFISNEYRADDISVRSNIVDRDFMSAACLLAGLYPPLEHQIWNPDIKWQPIPIWQQPFDISKMTTDASICPSFYKEMMEALGAVNSYQNLHQHILNFLNNQTGLDVKVLSDIYRFWEIFNLQVDAGYPQPEWVRAAEPEMANIYATSMAALTSATSRMIKLLAGPLLSNFGKQLQDKAKNKIKPNTKMHLEAGHETTINAVLPAFGFIEPFLVDPSALLILELHERGSQHFVEFLYFKNSKIRRPEILSVKDCVHPCPLENILKIIDNLKLDNWQEECQLLKQIIVLL